MASAAVLWFGEKMSAVPLRNSKTAASAVRAVTVLGRHRFDRRQHDGFAAGVSRPLSNRGFDRQHQRRGAGEAGDRIRRPLCCHRRSDRLDELTGRVGRDRYRMRRRRKRDHRSGRTSCGLGDGRHQRRGRIETGARGCRSRRDRGAGEQGMPGLRRRFLHAARGQGRAPASCRPIPNTTRCFRRSVPAIETNWFASSSPPRADRSGPGLPPTSSRRHWRRR